MRPPPPKRIPDRARSAWLSIVVFPAVLYLLLTLCDTIGLPFGVALVLTFILCYVAAVLFRPVRIVAVVFTLAAGLFLVLDTNRWSDLHSAVVTPAVVAVELTVAALCRAVLDRLPAPRWLWPRRRLARKRGWRYRARDAVPAARAPVGAPATERAAGVLTATIDGFECTIYDPVPRERPRIGKSVPTTWRVTLPVSVPGSHDFWTVSRQSAVTVSAFPNVGDPSWWAEGRYLCSVEYGRVPSAEIAARMDRLVRIASQVDWEKLTDPELWRRLQRPPAPQPEVRPPAPPPEVRPPAPLPAPLPEVRSPGPPPEVKTLNTSLFSERLLDAFRLAARTTDALTTGNVLDALVRADPMLDWERLWLRTGAPESIGLAAAPDRTGSSESWGRVTLSRDLSRALDVADAIRRRYGFPVITTGAAALGLVAHRDAGATQALLRSGDLSHARLLAAVQADIVGTTLENLASIIPAVAERL